VVHAINDRLDGRFEEAVAANARPDARWAMRAAVPLADARFAVDDEHGAPPAARVVEQPICALARSASELGQIV